MWAYGVTPTVLRRLVQTNETISQCMTNESAQFQIPEDEPQYLHVCNEFN